MVVVVGRPTQQFKGDRIEDRLLVQDLVRGLEFAQGKRRFGNNANQNADQTLTAKGHRDAHAEPRRSLCGRSRRRQVVENAAQRRVERDLQNHRSFVHKICG